MKLKFLPPKLLMAFMVLVSSIGPIQVIASPASSNVTVSDFEDITITGRVISAADGEPIPGASVTVKGTTRGVPTDMDGAFEISVPDENAVLVVSFIGFMSQEVPVGNRTLLNVQLQEDVSSLDEVVVVGYGTQRRADITGSVAIVETSEMKKFATSDVAQMLQGRVSGVQVTADGQPGAVPNVRVRGVGTFGNNQPLYVVDGVPVGTTVRDFNPNDIESMQVLKDASATAIYGSRAANGVVIITTRQGRKNTDLTVEYNGYYGIDQVWQRMPVLGRENYQMMANEVRVNAGRPLIPGNNPTSPVYINDVDNDWQQLGFKNGMRQNHNLGFSGGGERTTYNLSLDFFGNDGILVGNGPSYDRYSARLNTTAEKGIFKMGSSFYYTHSRENTLTFNDQVLTGGRPPLVNDLLMTPPTMRLYNPNNVGGFGGTDADVHSVIALNAPGINTLFENWVDVDRIFANIFGELQLLDKDGHRLKYRVNLGWDKTMTRDFSLVPEFNMGYFFNNAIARLNDGSRIFTVGLVENTLNYNKSFGNHNLDVLIGHTFQANSTINRNGYTEGLPRPYYPVLSNGTNQTASGSEFRSALDSYLGRINYDYDGKYLMTATIRQDGSSRFAPASRYGVFPSLALGWRISQEEFFPFNQDAVSDLKIRGSYGQLGNQEIGDYLYQNYVNRNIPYHFAGDDVVIGGIQTALVDPDIQWETATSMNIGLDGTLFKGKLTFAADYYNKTTTDLLVGVPIPASTGSINTAPVVNAGSLRNKGLDFDLGYHKYEGEFTFDINANVSTLSNEVLSLGGSNEPIYGVGTITRVGGEVGEHFGWLYDGLFQSQEEIQNHAFQNASTSPGDVRFVDVNGDGVINDADRVALGSSIPSLTYGFNFSARYKSFDFTTFASGASGYDIHSRLYRTLMHTSDFINWHEDILERWTPENTNTDIPRVVEFDPNNNGRDSNRPGWLQPGRHLRLNTVSLGYTIPENSIQGIRTARVYVTLQNLYTFQNYKAYNPDFTSGVFEPAFDNGSYPLPRTYMLGVQLSF
ncbi:SusC/RagA family TonB-linked outer membrane protein [Anditalea andensis]|uniref:TonB-dependent receptor n=1 Tax=Anditalea andensis TaxID=1048983 RepID=A0A074L1Q4_9BACT|nr:TonB-dependent receptor [Anditalea andensis]KEO74430.1 TonB-dependent receptor [Anditalea andensis]